MRKLFVAAICLISSYLSAQTSPTLINDEKSSTQILIGKCSRTDFSKVPYQQDYDIEYKIYVLNDSTISVLKQKVGNVTLKIIMGCWCGDSKEQVPRFFKVLDNMKFDEKNVEIVCVDRDKKAEGNDLSSLNIEKVPTFIISRGGVEIGRIIETPQVSLEKDFLQIVLK